MKYIALGMIICSVLFVALFAIEQNYISSLPSDSKLKKWWRRNLIGELPPDLED
jgi:hypothetical protein